MTTIGDTLNQVTITQHELVQSKTPKKDIIDKLTKAANVKMAELHRNIKFPITSCFALETHRDEELRELVEACLDQGLTFNVMTEINGDVVVRFINREKLNGQKT